MNKRRTINDSQPLVGGSAMLVIFLALIFSSCEKKFLEPEPGSEVTPVTYSIFPAEKTPSLRRSSFAPFPPRDLYKDVLVNLYTDSVFLENYDKMALEFGHPRINFATFNYQSPTEYILTLPLVKERQISAFIFYYANGNHGYFTFAPLSTGMALLDQHVGQNFDQDAILTMIKYNNLLYSRYSSYSPTINNWMKEYYNYHNQTDIINEGKHTMEIHFSTVSFPEKDIEEISIKSVNINILCPLQDEINVGLGSAGAQSEEEAAHQITKEQNDNKDKPGPLGP